MGTRWQRFEERPVKLIEHQWVIYEMLGGDAWLSRLLANRHERGISTRERNRRMAKDIAEGLPVGAIAEKYGISKTTVYRAMPEPCRKPKQTPHGNEDENHTETTT